jgi:hypothetical protein
MPRHGKYPDELRERAVRMVLDHGHEYGSQPSRDYHLKQLSDAEKAIVEQQEWDYEVLVAHWQPKRPAANGRRFHRGVHDGAQLDGELQGRHELSPGLFPGVDHGRVAVPPGVGTRRSRPRLHPGLGRCRSRAVPGRSAPVLLGGVTQRRTYQVHETQLDLGVGPGGPHGIGQALEAVAAHDEGVLHAAVGGSSVNKLIQNLAPSPPAGPTQKRRARHRTRAPARPFPVDRSRASVHRALHLPSAGRARSRPGAVIWLDAMASMYFGLGLDRGSRHSLDYHSPSMSCRLLSQTASDDGRG